MLRLPELAPADLSPGAARHERKLFDRTELTGVELDGMTITDCEFRNVSAGELQMEGSDLSAVVLNGIETPTWRAARTLVTDVSLDGGRIGLAELTGATLRSVTFAEVKFGTLDLRGSRMSDVRFVDCLFDRIEVDAASMTRVAFESCRADELIFTDAKTEQVDIRGLDMRSMSGIDSLRGVTISAAQLTLLADEYARRIGVIVSG